MRNTVILICTTALMLGLSACSEPKAANMDAQPVAKTAEGDIALTEVSGDVAHVIHVAQVEQEKEDPEQAGYGDMSKYIEVNPDFEGDISSTIIRSTFFLWS